MIKIDFVTCSYDKTEKEVKFTIQMVPNMTLSMRLQKEILIDGSLKSFADSIEANIKYGITLNLFDGESFFSYMGNGNYIISCTETTIENSFSLTDEQNKQFVKQIREFIASHTFTTSTTVLKLRA